jgi:peptide deformylase
LAVLDILHFPDPRLRNRAAPVTEVDESVRTLVADMLETMYAAPGIGLAAVQVNVPVEIIVIDVSERKNEPHCLINPRILEGREQIETEEGCLSVPGVYEAVQRAQWIRVDALGLDGRPYQFEAEGLLSVCIQHEIDHLSGRLFVDYLSRLKRQRIRKRALKQQREPQ